MKTYLIKNTDIQLNGKLFPEGTTIDLEDKYAKSLSAYLEEIKDNVTLSVSSRAESMYKGSTNNKEQKLNIKKRSK